MLRNTMLIALVTMWTGVSFAQEMQVTAAPGDPRVGRLLGSALYNGTNTECLVFANPVMAVGPFFGPVIVNGMWMQASYYNCHEYIQNDDSPGSRQWEIGVDFDHPSANDCDRLIERSVDGVSCVWAEDGGTRVRPDIYCYDHAGRARDRDFRRVACVAWVN